MQKSKEFIPPGALVCASRISKGKSNWGMTFYRQEQCCLPGIGTGGGIRVSGIIGEPDARGAMTGGGYSLTGGY